MKCALRNAADGLNAVVGLIAPEIGLSSLRFVSDCGCFVHDTPSSGGVSRGPTN